MLFRKDIEKYCTYCAHSRPLNEEQMLCPKRGIVAPNDHCRKFVYDPLKRVPPKKAELDFSRFSDEDFTL